LIREAGPNVAMFSSDYPHREGGRFPIQKFDANLDKYDISPEDRERFYWKNYEDMLAGWARTRSS
jgi:predicted TIM-barrel fold metal-dependent hydrolase